MQYRQPQPPVPQRQSVINSNTNMNQQQQYQRDSNYSSKNKNEQSHKLYQQKLKALGKVRYLNQLAQMQYEDKFTQLHSKYSSKTKQSVQKKLRAKNQIAEFVDEEEEELQQQFQELMDFKYGASKWKNFHYQRESVDKDYFFCSLCDEIYKENQSEHQRNCKYQELAKSPLYYFQSLDRIKSSLKRLTSQQAAELSMLTQKIKNSENVSRQLLQIMPMVRNDEVLGKIAAKLQQIQEETQ